MGKSARGLSTVECITAITIVSLGLMGALGTLAAAIRLAHEGDHAAASARLVLETVDHIRASLASAGGRCGAVSSGEERSLTGESVTWDTTPVARGLTIRLRVGSWTPQGERADTVASFVPCLA